MTRNFWKLLPLLMAAAHPPARCADDARPVGPNCGLQAPPPASGFAQLGYSGLLVFPRAMHILATYSGCQAVFLEDGKQEIYELVVVEKGNPVRIWLAPKFRERHARNKQCVYRDGKPLRDAEICPPSARELLLPSIAPACVKMEKFGEDKPECNDWK
jgi:hypothetical protein